LRQQQQDWDASRRKQAQELVDKAERLRRQEESARREAELRAAARQDLQQAKQQVVGGLDEARAQTAAVEAELDLARAHLNEARGLLAGFAIVCVLAAVAWIVAAWLSARVASVGLASLFLAVALVMNYWRSRLGAAPPVKR
jgi:Flp pilus assembly protein TadB